MKFVFSGQKNLCFGLDVFIFLQIPHHKGCSLFLEQKMMMRNTFLMISLLSLMKFVGVKERMQSGGRQQGECFHDLKIICRFWLLVY